MYQWVSATMAVLLLVPMVAHADATDEEAFWAEREAELMAIIAPAGGVDELMLASTDPLAAMRAGRALDADLPEDFALQVFEAGVAQKLREEIRGVFLDPNAVVAAQAEGELSVERLGAIGFSPAALLAQAPLLAQLAGTSTIEIEALARAIEQPPAVWQQDTWDDYGLVLEVAYLALAASAPELAGWILPHDARVIAQHVGLRLVGPIQEGNTKNGRIWTQLYLDVLVGVAFDNHGLADALVIQLPVTLFVELRWTCTQELWGICVGWNFVTTVGPGDAVVATNASYTFGYPHNGGQLATRATGQDLLQSVYDRLGTIPRPAETEFLLAPPAADAPGVSDLATAAPRLTFTGTQLPAELAEVRGMFRNARVHAPAGIAIEPLGVVPHNLGATVGYTATEVVNGGLTILIVRWHNLGLEDTAAPATFYYDVPPGQYKVTNDRVDAYGGVNVNDWTLTGALPVDAPAAP